ncbi:MAG: hypothetical protein JSW13_01695 [Candidatus Aerophobus sp.]|nr:MAG: hypothetical protein JSW13_01695 [Candidatus Aerophobus sp.]
MKKLASFAMVFALFLPLMGEEETPYTNYSFARLSYITGKIYVQRAADLGYEEGVVNMPVTEGDRLGTTEGRAEVYMGKRNYLRLDQNTKVDFLNLPKRGYDLTRIRVWSGNILFNIAFLEKEKNIEIHTSDVSIYVLDRGLYRIDVRENRETEIYVFDGLVEAAGEEGSVLIKNEQRIEVKYGHFTSRPTEFYADAGDSFEQWSEYRDSQLNKRVAKRYLPEELEDFEYELAAYGNWVYHQPYGYVWSPYGLAPGWRPYYYGRWLWYPLCGWCWLPYEPWGWSTFHFGRWHWSIGLGWYWIPTPYWGPGWVSWYWGYDYFGWAPLSYYGYPLVVRGNYYYYRYHDRYYPYNSRALTVIRKRDLRAPNVSDVALNQESIKKLGKISLSNNAPPLKPVPGKVTVEKLSENKFLLKKGHESSKALDRKVEKGLSKTPVQLDSRKIKEKKAQIEKSPQSKAVVGGKTKGSTEVKKKLEKEKVQKESRGYIKGGIPLYPSSSKISIKNIPRSSRTTKKSSFFRGIYNFLTGSSSSKYTSGSKYRSTSKGTTSKRVSSRSRSGSSSSGRSSSGSSSGRSSSSGSRSSGSGSGRTKK